MKVIEIPEGCIWDFGDKAWPETEVHRLVVVPMAVLQAAEPWPAVVGPCGGFVRRSSRTGRDMVKVLPGAGFRLVIQEGAGDVTWGGWRERLPVGDPDAVYALAAPTSHGRGCWIEASITPEIGALTAAQAAYVRAVGPGTNVAATRQAVDEAKQNLMCLLDQLSGPPHVKGAMEAEINGLVASLYEWTAEERARWH